MEEDPIPIWSKLRGLTLTKSELTSPTFNPRKRGFRARNTLKRVPLSPEGFPEVERARVSITISSSLTVACRHFSLHVMNLPGKNWLHFGLLMAFSPVINMADLDIMGQLKSMPLGMGNLTNLQTLSAFLVGKDDGCWIIELKNTINLRGAFCISRIENVSSFEEALEADLMGKKFLSRLQLRWTETREHDATKEEQILQRLQPPLGLEESTIVRYGGFKLPSWIDDPSYDHLVGMTLYNCMNCECLPPIGKLPSLQFLYIKEMYELIDEQFCKDGKGEQSHAFPSLKELTIEVMPALEEWIGVQDGDFPCLLKLKVEHCPKLVSLPLLSCLSSFKHLEIGYCPNISSLPRASPEYLLI